MPLNSLLRAPSSSHISFLSLLHLISSQTTLTDDYADDFELSLDAHGLPSARARDASPEDDILDLAIERELHEQDQVSLLALSLDTPREPEAPAPSSARPPTGLVLADRRGLTPASVPPLQPSASVHLKDSRSLRPSSSIARSIEEPLGQLKTTSKFMTAHHLEGNRDPSPTASRLNTAVAGPSMPPTAARAVTPRGPEPPQPPIILEPDLPSPVPAARSKPPPPARAPSLLTESICDLAMLLNGVAPVDLATLDGHGDAEKPSSAAMSEMESEYERAMGELEGLLHELRAREAVESAVADAPRGRETPGRSAPSSAPEAAPTAASASSESALEAAGAPSTAYVTENLMRIEHHDRAASDPDPEPPSTGESTGSVVEVNLAETDPWLFKPAYEKCVLFFDFASQSSKRNVGMSSFEMVHASFLRFFVLTRRARKVAEEIAAKRKREQELEETVRKIKELEARIMAQAEDEASSRSIPVPFLKLKAFSTSQT